MQHLLCLAAAIGHTLGFWPARLITWHRDKHLGGGQWLGFRSRQSKSGVHLHHMVFGAPVGFVATYAAIVCPWDGVRVALTFVAFGGFGVVIDQWALIVHVKDVYWKPEGRLSVRVGTWLTVVLWAAFAAAWLLS